MSKFKVGDKVRVLPRLKGRHSQGIVYVHGMLAYVGKEFVIQKIRKNDGVIALDSIGYVWHEDWLELVDKPFTQEDLEVGMLVECKYCDIYNINSEPSARIARKAESIVAIYKHTETGFERVWTRPEPKLYTLELPGKEREDSKFYNQYKGNDSYLFDCSLQTDHYKTKFTQEEIENLPNQELINVLIKKEVVE